MPEALDPLRQDHRNMAALLRLLEQQVDEFRSGKRPDYDVISAILKYFVSFPDAYHHPREDLVFARLRDRDPLAAERIGDLRSAHEELAARAQEFSTGVQAVLEEAEMPREAFIRLARRFIDQQQQHIDMEESVFFPTVEKMLTMTDWAELNALLARTEDAGERFEQLRKTILQWQAEDETAADQDRDPNRHSMRKSSLTQHWR
jgi:hemerythrin-like domain-containing protein